LDRDRHRNRGRAAASELLDEHDARREVAVAPAEAGRIVQAEEAELTAPAEQRVGEVSCSLPFVHVGTDLRVDEPAHRRSKLVMLGAEDGVGAAHASFYAATQGRLAESVPRRLVGSMP